jgi:hypothetical protein
VSRSFVNSRLYKRNFEMEEDNNQSDAHVLVASCARSILVCEVITLVKYAKGTNL